MIKLMHVQCRDGFMIYCEFSDGTSGVYDLEHLLWSHDTQMTVPLRDQAAFRKVFLRSGALCWSNGLELDPQAIHMELERTGKLVSIKKAA